MKSSIFILLSLILISIKIQAQNLDSQNVNELLDVTATVGASQGTTALSYVYNWALGSRNKFEVGLGLRLTSTFGKTLDFTTAGPARLTRSYSTPFVIFFAGQKTENWDTLTVQSPQINALNLTVNLGYNFNARLAAGFNIDLIGASFGRKSTGILLSQGIAKTEPQANPSAFNLLLTGDHDIGTLNSEFFLKYRLNSKWSLRAVYQFLFTEYKTNNVKQIAPDGTEVVRFRNKGNNFGLGIAYRL